MAYPRSFLGLCLASFVAVAVPLFAGGVLLAYLVVARGLAFLLPGLDDQTKAMLGEMAPRGRRRP